LGISHRLADTFAQLRADKRPGLVTYTTAGDPDLPRSAEILKALDRAGADVLEVGVPFSDPLADGPVIQRSSERALKSGVTLKNVLAIAKQIRAQSELPLLLFTYMNPIHRYGSDALARDAKEVGIDGVLVTDLPPEEAGGWLSAARASDLDTVFLVAPTSPEARIRKIAEASRGFVYAVSRTGITGEKQSISDEARPLVENVRAVTRVPVALGFGISTPEQVKAAAAVADGIVVGSALVRFLEEQPSGDVTERVRWLKSAL
jgi:tryptophan synthase alpha chain